MAHVKKNDQVVVLTGKDQGKRGTVIQVLPTENKVMVQGVGIVVKHVKARKQGDVAGIKKEERFIALSNVMPICPACNKPCRVKAKFIDNDKKVRACHRCQAVL
jgi:large subunit ribosomal protein L24